MELKIVELVLQNYEKKMKEYDINYYTINNLQNLIDFNLLELDLKENEFSEIEIKNIIS